MSEAYLGEIRIVPYYFEPAHWMRCDGQLLSIAQNTALFSLIGTYYGGNGQTTFALPDLRDRMPLAAGQGPGLSYYDLGQQEGDAAAHLDISEMPGHTHTMQASAGMPAFNGANGHVLAKVSSATPPYHAAQNLAYAAPGMLQPNGGSQPHNNRQPYLGLTFVICAQGTYPSRV